MPCSIAACSTVLPFSTVSFRPSIVRVTVSITYRLYLLLYVSQGARILVDFNRPHRALQWDHPFDGSVRYRNHDVLRCAVRVGHSHRNRKIEHVASLFEPHLQLVANNRRREAHRRNAAAINPPIEEPREWTAAACFLHRLAEVVGARLVVAPRRVEISQARKERLVTEKAAEHVQDHRPLVVDERAERASLAADVAEAVPEIDGPLPGERDRPFAHLAKDGRELVGTTLAFGIQRGEVLRESFAEPLLVVIFPPDRLSPPLVCDLVRDEKRRIVLERDGIVVPHERRRRHRLVEHGEIRGTVAARHVTFGHGERERVVGSVSEQRRVELQDFCCLLRQPARLRHLSRIRRDGQRNRFVVIAQLELRHRTGLETADENREIARWLTRFEHDALPGTLPRSGLQHRWRTLSRAAGDDIE